MDLLRLVTEAALASPWLLAVIAGLAVVDALLPVVPSEALIIAAGVAAAAGEQDLPAVIAAAACGSFLGECAGYAVGRRIGPAVRTRSARRAAEHDRAVALLHRRGGTVLLTARFVPAGRTVAVLASGALRYPAARFVGFTAVGSVLSASWSALLGFAGGAAFAHDTGAALLVGFGIATAAGLLLEAARRITRAGSRGAPVVEQPAAREVDVRASCSDRGSPDVDLAVLARRSLRGDEQAAPGRDPVDTRPGRAALS